MGKSIPLNELSTHLKDNNNVLIDVRETEELEETGYIPGALHYPMSNIENDMHTLNNDKTYYVICRAGRRSLNVQQYLLDNGYDAVNVESGMSQYEGPVEHVKSNEDTEN